jgi:hypothetical protein
VKYEQEVKMSELLITEAILSLFCAYIPRRQRPSGRKLKTVAFIASLQSETPCVACNGARPEMSSMVDLVGFALAKMQIPEMHTNNVTEERIWNHP